jgi:hypothetical protein
MNRLIFTVENVFNNTLYLQFLVSGYGKNVDVAGGADALLLPDPAQPEYLQIVRCT